MAENLKALQAAYAAKVAEAEKAAGEWAGKEDQMPEEVATKIEGLLGESDVLLTRIDMFKKLTGARSSVEEPQGTQAAGLQWRNAGPSEGNVPVDEKSWRALEVPTFSVDSRYGIVIPTVRKFRYHVPLATEKRGYPSAFEAYLRKGIGEVGPTDRKTLSEGVDSAGGYLVSDDWHSELLKKQATMATIRSYARVVQTSKDLARWPKIHYTTDDEYTSAVRLTWTGENPSSSTVHRVTDPVFGLFSIAVHTAMASMPFTNDFLEDADFDVFGIATDLMAESFALGENDAFLNGTGTARPMGLLTQVGGDGPAAVNSGTAATLTANGLIDLVYAIPAQYDINSRFLMNKATEKVIRKLKTTGDDYIWPIVQTQGQMAPTPNSLLGYPVMKDEFMPDVAANAYPVVFGDLRAYLVLDRVGFSIQRLSELYAETNITVLLARKRVGGQTIEPWRIKAHKVAA